MKMLNTIIVRLVLIYALLFFSSLTLSLMPVSGFAANVKIERASFFLKSVSDKATQRYRTQSIRSQDEQKIPIVWMRIQGAGFSPDAYVNRVLIDQQKIPVVKATPNEILSILPSTVSPGEHNLTVSVDKDTAVKDVKIGRDIGKTGLLNFPMEETEDQSSLIYSASDSTAVYSFSKNEYFSIYLVQNLDRPSSSSEDSIFLKEIKVLKPVPNLATYIQNNNFLNQNNYIFSLNEVERFSPGTNLMIAALLNGNSARLDHFDVRILIRDSNGNTIGMSQPLVQSVKFDRGKDHFDNYEALVYFVFPLPAAGLSESVQIEFLVDTPTSQTPLVKEVKRLTAESRTMPIFAFDKALLSVNKNISFLKEDVDYFNLPPAKSFGPGQHIALVSLFSVNNTPSKAEDIINCGFDITKNNKNIVTYSTSILQSREGFNNGCVFDFIAPEELIPGVYSVYPWLKTANIQAVKKGSFEITVLPYQPNIVLDSWIVSPLNLREISGRIDDFRDQTIVFLANTLAESRKNKRIGLLTDIETKGFSPLTYSNDKHILQYSFVLLDKKGKEYKKSEKYSLDRVNGNMWLYITLTVPQDFVSGLVKGSLEVEIDGVKAQTQNSFNLL